jgi:hypothetical protein
MFSKKTLPPTGKVPITRGVILNKRDSPKDPLWMVRVLNPSATSS